jgi:predicted GNAT family acetyltransferase
MDQHKITLRDNPEKKQFEFDTEGELSRIEYIIAKGDTIYLTHTEVPEKLGGKGYGKMIVALALQEVEARKLKLVSLCPYVAGYIRKNPECERLLK